VANLPLVSTTPEAIATGTDGVVDTGGKFATGVNDTGGESAVSTTLVNNGNIIRLLTP
jgi:hypothetical protein